MKPRSRSKTPYSLKEIQQRLRALREAMGWSQAELARRFGVSSGAANHWESGETRMSGTALKLLEMYEKKAAKFEEG